MGIVIFQIIILGGISLDIHLEIMFYGFSDCGHITEFLNINPMIYLPT